MTSVVFLVFLCYNFINKVELEISVCVTTTSWRRGWDRSAENTGFDHFDDTFGIFDCDHAAFAVTLILDTGIRSQVVMIDIIVRCS